MRRGSSTETLRIFLPDEDGGECIGEIYIEEGLFVAVGEEADDTAWLLRKLEHTWVPQAGIPVFEQTNGTFTQGPDGRYIRLRYANHLNSTADELLRALFDYLRAFGGFRFEMSERS
jgi:hypothetical protein